MNEYTEVMEELDGIIREARQLKKTIATDAANMAAKTYKAKTGSAAMVQRVKLNIRDHFRRIESNFKWESGKTVSSYNQLIFQGSKLIKEGEE